MKGNTSGFSLLELLVVVAIVSIFASIAIFGLSDSQSQSRDAKRLADLRLVENAVELFKNKYGHYPSGCNGSTTVYATTEWSGEQGTGEECASGNEYIVNLAPEFIPALPRDPRAGRGDPTGSGYVYTVNEEGSVYKFMALNSVENETVDQLHDFYRCDKNTWTLAANGNATNESWLDGGLCWRSWDRPDGNLSNGRQTAFTMSQCSTASEYENDYAISAGYSSDATGATTFPDKAREFDTEIVRCK